MLDTEALNPRTAHLDQMSAQEMVTAFQVENRRAVDAVEAALPEIAAAVEAAAQALRQGGRIFYVGCGTSGRIAAQDAAECPPTYGTDPGQVVAILAGGPSAMVRAAEGAEDSAEEGVRDLDAYAVTAGDLVIGISASGNARYVCAALERARALGARTVSVSSNKTAKIAAIAEIVITTPTGAEAVAGSTRMKAGTAQKLVLNMISTGAMVLTGHVMGNLMINLKPTNEKLRHRMIGIVSHLTGLPEDDSEALLEASGWNIRAACSLHPES